MKKSRFTDEQIIGMIKEQEAGTPTAEVCRKYGVSSALNLVLAQKNYGREITVYDLFGYISSLFHNN